MKGMRLLKRASPTILTCLAAAGVIATAILSARATPKAVKLIESDSRVNHEGDPKAYTKAEAVKSCWKCYIPAAAFGLSTIFCIFGANVLNKKQQAALTSAYGMLNQSYQKYRKAAKSVYGDNADAKIKTEMATEQYISADGMSLYSPDIVLEKDKILFYDTYSQRYFTTTVPAVLNAQYHLNRNLTLRGVASVNEFYNFLGIDRIDDGDEIIWSLSDMMENGIMWLDFENRYTKMEDGMECCVISMLYEPALDLPF